MLNDFSWNMTDTYQSIKQIRTMTASFPMLQSASSNTGTGAASGGQSERIYPVCLTGKFAFIFILPAALRAHPANKRIQNFLCVDGGDLARPEPVIDIKLSCGQNIQADQTILLPRVRVCYAVSVHLGFYAPFPHGRKMVDILSDQLQGCDQWRGCTITPKMRSTSFPSITATLLLRKEYLVVRGIAPNSRSI